MTSPLKALRGRHRKVLAAFITALVAATAFFVVSAAAPGTAQAASGFPTTSYGATGTNVKAIQYMLNAHGIATTVDGSYGPATRTAVAKFQSAHHLSATGTADNATMAVLAPSAKQGNPNLNTVKAVQVELNKWGAGLVVDGSFGPVTTTAVKSFQSRHGLVADGLVGPITWPVLFKSPSGGLGPIVGVPQAGTSGSGPAAEQWHNCGPASFVMALLRLKKTPVHYTSADHGAAAVYYARHTTLGMSDPNRGTSQIGLSGLIRGFAKYGVSAYTGSVTTAESAMRGGHPSMIIGNARVTGALWPEHLKPGTSYVGHWIFLAGYNSSTGRYIVVDPLAINVVPHEMTATQLARFNSGSGAANIITR